MSTTVIDHNEARIPFFGDKMSFITGLDPLGLQNPSTQMYSYLLPGLNNVTTRIRNYSFYCWLLQEYAKIIENSDPKEQRKFIRRAEYLIALLSAYADIEGISGINYAINRRKENLEEFNLQKGTYNSDGTTEKTYWQYSSGIFGQYYLGSLRQIGLVEEPVNAQGEFIGIYRRTAKKEGIKVSGQELADSFDSILNPDIKSLFLDCIKKGIVTIQDLVTLVPGFNLAKISDTSLERELLITLLLDFDEPPRASDKHISMRRETLVHLLKFITHSTEPFDQRAFTMFAYNSKGVYENKLDNCLTGWYYYQLNEYYQVASTAVFNGCLDFLAEKSGPGWMPLESLINACKNEIVELIEKHVKSSSELSVVEKILKSDFGSEQELFEGILKSEKIQRMTYGFLLLWQLYKGNKENLMFLRVFSNERNIGDNDDVITYYLNFEKQIKLTVSEFVYQYISHYTIQRHQHVAYRKMGGGSQSTQKFIIEDNYIRQIGNFAPGYTSPRITSLTSFMIDLNLMTKNFKLTTEGETLLEQF